MSSPMLEKQKTAKYRDILLFVLGMLPLTWMLLVKCRYGFADIDESFYLTIPYRLCQGDRLLLNEWHLSQLAGWILKLPMAVFLRLNGGTEGICLAFRYLYVVFHLCGSVILFSLLRRRSGLGAAVGCLFFYLYVPFGISACSYNSMGIDFLALAAVLLVTCRKSWTDALSGFCFAMAVLCCPYLVILFALYGAAVIFCRKQPETLPFLGVRRFLFFLVGVLLPALCFLADVVPYIPLRQYPRILSGMLSDPEHQESFSFKLLQFIGIFPEHPFLIVLGLLTLASVKLPRVRSIADILVLAVTALGLWQGRDYINNLMLPLNMAGLYFYIVYRNPKARDLFWGIWIPGMVYALSIHLSSNQVYYAMGSAFTVATPASVILILLTLNDRRKEMSPSLSRCLAAALVLVLAFQGGLEGYLRWNQVFWSRSPQYQTQLLTEGPHKGLLVTPSAEETYLTNLEKASHLAPGGSLLTISRETYFYLFGSRTNSSYTAWLGTRPEVIAPYLDLYYDINPDKLPDQVLIQPDYRLCTSYFTKDLGYSVTCTFDDGGVILRRPTQ